MKLESVRKHALSMQAVTEEPYHSGSSFRVRSKIFVAVPPDETAVHVFVADEDRDLALAMYPEFVERLLWGGKAVGVRVRLALAIPAVVKSLMSKAYEARVRRDAGPKAPRGRGRSVKS